MEGDVQNPLSSLPILCLSLILIVFFLYLNAISVPNVERESKVMTSVHQRFGKDSDDRPSQHTSFRPPSQPFSPIPELESPLIEGVRPPAPPAYRDDIVSLMTRHGFHTIASDEKLAITIPGESLFASGNADLRPEVVPILDDLARVVKQHGLYTEVDGHTDDQPIHSARFKSNWELSVARALSVARLLSSHGVPEERVAAYGRAQYQPIASNGNEAGRAENRRVEIIVSKNPSAARAHYHGLLARHAERAR